MNIDARYDKQKYVNNVDYRAYHELPNKVNMEVFNKWLNTGKDLESFESDADFQPKKEIFNAIYKTKCTGYQDMIDLNTTLRIKQ